MKTPKTQIKKIISKRLKLCQNMPDQFINEAVANNYKVFLGDLKILTGTIFSTKDYQLENDCVVFQGSDNRPYYYEIQSNGHLIDISREVWQEAHDRIDTVNEALKN